MSDSESLSAGAGLTKDNGDSSPSITPTPHTPTVPSSLLTVTADQREAALVTLLAEAIVSEIRQGGASPERLGEAVEVSLPTPVRRLTAEGDRRGDEP